jgi:hypothetical protein
MSSPLFSLVFLIRSIFRKENIYRREPGWRLAGHLEAPELLV